MFFVCGDMQLLSGGQSAKAAAAAVAAAATGNDRATGSGSGTTGNRFQIAMPIDQIQVRTVVGEQCQKARHLGDCILQTRQ